MRKTNKKGFTIVELVVVIAVIAILAAVLIPTFSGIIKKANLSADQQAVRQMNETLAMAEAEGRVPEKVMNLKAILADNGYASDLDPVSAGYDFGWIQEENVIVLVHAEKVVYPEKYVDYDINKVGRLNVEMATGAQDFVDFANGTLTQNGLNSIVMKEEINLFNASSQLDSNKYFNFADAGDLEIDGNGNTLKTTLQVTGGTSLTLNDVTINDGGNSKEKYTSAVKPLDGEMYLNDVNIISTCFGMAQNVKHAKDADGDVKVVAKNCTIDAPVALYIGVGDWTFENCTFKGTVTIAGGNVTFKNCTFIAQASNTPGFSADPLSALGSGCFYIANGETGIVIEDGRDISGGYESGTVTFENCKTDATIEKGYADLTYTAGNATSRTTLTIVGTIAKIG